MSEGATEMGHASHQGGAGSLRFQDRVAVVSGAAGGIGRAVGEALLSEGARLAALDLRRSDDMAEAAWFECDVSRPDSVRAAAERIQKILGAPDVVVHCAAVTVFKDTLSTTLEEFERIMRVNVFGAFLLTQAFAPAMRERRRGAIVHVSSITGIVGAPGLSAYSVSKGALITLTRTSALELAEYGVRVNCVCPASVDTPMLQASFDITPNPELARRLNIKRHPLGRLGTPEDVARFVLFLASDEAAWVTGGTHIVDGGASIARRWKE